MLTIQQLNNLQDAAKAAYQCEVATGIPSELTLAQWAEESGWGAHTPGNNCFGIKDYPGSSGRQLLYTREHFTDSQLTQWLAQVPGRTAVIESMYSDITGSKMYKCRDWFATFPTIAHCFVKRASLFHSQRYMPAMQAYRSDGNLVSLIQSIAPIYATYPNYAMSLLRICSIPEMGAAIQQAKGGTI